MRCEKVSQKVSQYFFDFSAFWGFSRLKNWCPRRESNAKGESEKFGEEAADAVEVEIDG